MGSWEASLCRGRPQLLNHLPSQNQDRTTLKKEIDITSVFKHYVTFSERLGQEWSDDLISPAKDFLSWCPLYEGGVPLLGGAPLIGAFGYLETYPYYDLQMIKRPNIHSMYFQNNFTGLFSHFEPLNVSY